MIKTKKEEKQHVLDDFNFWGYEGLTEDHTMVHKLNRYDRLSSWLHNHTRPVRALVRQAAGAWVVVVHKLKRVVCWFIYHDWKNDKHHPVRGYHGAPYPSSYCRRCEVTGAEVLR